MKYENCGWTQREIDRLHRMKCEGLTFIVIGDRLGKRAGTVAEKWRQLQEAMPPQDTRAALEAILPPAWGR